MQERDWSGFDERLCPVVWAAPLGMLNIMPRCAALTDDEFLTEVGEDWVTDLSDDEASYLPIAVLLGYGEDERERGGERGSGSFGAVWSVEGARVSLKDMN